MTITEDQAATIMSLISFSDSESTAGKTDYQLAKEVAAAFPKLATEYSRLLADADKMIEFAQKQAEKNLAHMAMIEEGVQRRKRESA